MTSRLRSPLALRPRAVAGPLALVVGLGLAGCSGSDTPAPPPGPEQSAAPDTSPDGLDGASPDGTPGRPSTRAPSPRRTEPPPWVTRPGVTRPPAPGATAPAPDGEGRAFPRPEDLGPAWTYRPVLGLPADGRAVGEEYVDAGVPVALSDPASVVRTAVPGGCRSLSSAGGASPAPRRATTLAYEVAGEWVDATRAQFATPRQARQFAAERRATLRACTRRDAEAAVGPLVTRVLAVDAVTVLSDRTPQSDAYSELSVVDGDTVVLLSRRTDTRPTLRAARALAAAFTGSRVPGGIS